MSRYHLQAGALDTPLVLQRPEISRGEMGGEIVSFVDVATVYARRRAGAMRDDHSLARHRAELELIFTIRYRTDIKADWRVICDGVIYSLIGEPQMQGRSQFLDMRCVSVDTLSVADGATASDAAGDEIADDAAGDAAAQNETNENGDSPDAGAL